MNSRKFAVFILWILGGASIAATFFFANDPQLDHVLEGASLRHWMGTDSLGRDLLLRVLQGNFLSWMVGIVAALVAFAVGVTLGFWAGWKSGRVDFAMMRFLEILDSVPSVVLVTLFVLLFREWTGDRANLRVFALAAGIGLTHWMSFMRLTRVLTLQESQAAFIEGAVAIGAGPLRIFRIHLWPHLLQTLKQSLWAHLPSFFLFESLISFLGFGLQPPETSLGVLLQDGWKAFSVAPHLLLAPGFLLFLTLFCFQISFDRPEKSASRQHLPVARQDGAV